MGLLGLLEPADSEPVVVDASAAAHDDVTTAEVQAVCAAAVDQASTRRPIVAVSANALQLTRVIVTQGGQVKVVACISSGRKARVVNTTAAVVVDFVCCT